MSLNVAELRDLLRRAQLSAARGYQIALGDHYAARLGGSDGSPVGLVGLCKKALAALLEPTDDVEDAAPPTLVPTAPEPEPEPALVEPEAATSDAPAAAVEPVASPAAEPLPVEAPVPEVPAAEAPLVDIPVEAPVELAAAVVEAPPQDATDSVEAPVEAVEAPGDDFPEDDSEGEGEGVEGEPVEGETPDVAKDPGGQGSGTKRSKRRRARK